MRSLAQANNALKIQRKDLENQLKASKQENTQLKKGLDDATQTMQGLDARLQEIEKARSESMSTSTTSQAGASSKDPVIKKFLLKLWEDITYCLIQVMHL